MFGTVPNSTPPRVTVRVANVNYHYGAGESRNQVLFDNCADIEAGQLVVMTGPSGSGKTTLLSLIGALRSLQSGRIEVLGHALAGLQDRELVAVRRDVGFIFQMHNLFESLTAFENVKMAMQLSGCPHAEMRRRGAEILEQLGLGDRVDYKPKALSSGQRQRVAVARALVNRPKLILADEPTAALDRESGQIVVRLLKELTTAQGCTVMMVTHDSRLLEHADRIISMVDGRIRTDIVLHHALVICEVLRSVEMLKELTPAEIAYIAERMKRRHYAKGQVIVREGDPAEEFFVVGSGSVEALRRLETGEYRRRRTLGPGDFFGERALADDLPRNPTCIATTDVEVYALGKASFKSALGPMASFRDQIYAAYFQHQ
jgi:putative ABC transport system ATP-binding protein